MKHVNISGVILAGGKSSRMNFNKAFAYVGDKTVIEIICAKFASFFSETIIISNQPHLYQKYCDKVFVDIYPGRGPMSGIHAAIYHSSNDAIFVLGCDMPFVNMQIVSYLISQLNGYDCVIPRVDGYLQTTCGLYTKKCYPVLTECLEKNKLKLSLTFAQLHTRLVEEEELAPWGNIRESFFNLNDPDTLKKAREISGRLLK
ncbi:MAG: molybdenum cofactor guanylyltransferase [Syntrophomonadaceae bacterium]|jgi:molybdopterin-guanine dinucleotide biosynthesis protein A